jgi:large subunit ribosomal protein L7Ae
MSRMVKWPRYVRVQRQRAILKQRILVPPSVNQFSRTLDKNQATNAFKLLAAYKPETKVDKKQRLLAQAANGTDEKAGKKPVVLKFGLNHVTDLVEKRKAKLVVIAHDVDPLELVLWLPALCRKKDIPYCIVKGKSRLGHLVHGKTASCVALTEVRKEDQAKLDQLISSVNTMYGDAKQRKKWGGGIMGIKAQHVQRKKDRGVAREAAIKRKL